MPQVDYIHHELAEKLPVIARVSDAVAGTRRVKAAKTTYLPKPNATDTSAENEERYKAYIERALFLGATGQTLEGFVGEVFAKDPTMEVPPIMDFILVDADAAGNSLVSQSKEGMRLQFKKGGGGLLVDYPKASQEARPPGAPELSKADVEALGLRPRIIQYHRDTIINWRKQTVQGRVLLTLVVLKEKEVVEDDGFEAKTEDVYRVLRLNVKKGEEVFYYVERWKKGKHGFELLSTDVPQDGWGKQFNQIQFFPFGWDNNEIEPSSIPLEQLAELDFGWYRNSADYEEASFIAGQPTPVLAGLDEAWVKDVMKGRVELGSRAAIPLPQGGTAMLLQATANSMPKEAMTDKQTQMAAIGGELVTQGVVQKSATEASLDASARTSVLGSAAGNYSEACESALKSVAAFLRVEIPETKEGEDAVLEFALSTDFDLAKMTAQERAQLLAEWQGGGITFEEYRWNLKKAGVAYLDDEKAKDQIESSLGGIGGPTAQPGANEDEPGEPGQKPDPKKSPKAGPKDQPVE